MKQSQKTMNEDNSKETQHLTLAAKVAYNGAPFSGFARQPSQLTVQGEIEHALELLFRREVLCICAGRTDAGVHAKGQVVSFNVEKGELRERSYDALCRSVNALVHDDIHMRCLCDVPFGFSARFDAISREYRYFLAVGKPPLFMKDFCWAIPCTLDVSAMQDASKYLIGEHDFKSFCKAQSAEGKPTHRCVSEISIERVCVLGEELLQIKVVGNAFLHSMVRTIVGTLVAVGKGARNPLWVRDVLGACDRRAAGECAPAHGLTFWKVNY